jgi:hypothetical protein
VSAIYDVFGTILVRECPEAEVIIARLREYPAGAIAIDVSEGGPDILAVTLEGGGSFAAGDVLDFDRLLQSLGPYTMVPAVLATTYDCEEGELVVARTDAESRETLSRHRLDQIDMLLRDVTPEDRARLADRLRAG